jgi:hypothetical protein
MDMVELKTGDQEDAILEVPSQQRGAEENYTPDQVAG